MTPPKDPDRPDLPINVDKVVGTATDRAASLDYVRPELARKRTLPGGTEAVRVPGPPALPLEAQATLPAPHRNPLRHDTIRRPTPPSTLAALERLTPGTTVGASGTTDAAERDLGPLPPPSQDPDTASREALRRENAELRAERDELARRERVRAETASPNTFPPKVEQRRDSPVPPSSNAKTDQAIGAGVRVVLARLWPFFLAAAGVGGGVTAVAKPSADPAKADATLAHLEELTRKVNGVDAKVNGLLDREPQLTEFVECLYEQQADYFEQLLPSQQRLVTGSLQRTWVDRCRNRRPKR